MLLFFFFLPAALSVLSAIIIALTHLSFCQRTVFSVLFLGFRKHTHMTDSCPCLFKKKYIYIYLFERVIERVQGETIKNLPSVALFPTWLQWSGMGQADARNQELHLDLYYDWQGPKEVTFCCLCQAISRTLYWKWSVWDVTLWPCGIAMLLTVPLPIISQQQPLLLS